MASAIDTTKPVFGSPTTASVRANFTAAKNEIEALQLATFTLTVSLFTAGELTLPGGIGETLSIPLFDYDTSTSFIICRVYSIVAQPDVSYNIELYDGARLVYQATGITGDADYNDTSLFFVDSLIGTNLAALITNNTATETDFQIGIKYLAATGGE